MYFYVTPSTEVHVASSCLIMLLPNDSVGTGRFYIFDARAMFH